VLDCADVAREIERQLDTGGEPRAELVAHIERCLRCQAELARHRKLLRLLAQLRDEVVPLPEGLLAGVLAAVGEAAERQAIRGALSRHSVAYAGGVGAALVVLVVVGIARKRSVRERHA
jgi:anti-sigma factor RsiW